MLNPGDSIDAWIVEKAIGSGGMGSVYRCRNRHSARILAAVKILDPLLIRQIPEVRERFIREAEILFGIDHPNVVKVRNLRLDHDPPFLEMEFIEGESLEARLCRGPIPELSVLDLARQLFDALAYLHGLGICHRDIKPSNLLISPDSQLKLVDFGLASEVEASRITSINTTFGTVSYAPPEWIRPDELDPATWDTYACGVVVWEMLTGKVAFPGSTSVDPRQQAVQIMALKQSHPPLDPGPAFRDDVRAFCRELTRPQRNERLRDLGAIRLRLERLGSGTCDAAREFTPTTAPRQALPNPLPTAGAKRPDWGGPGQTTAALPAKASPAPGLGSKHVSAEAIPTQPVALGQRESAARVGEGARRSKRPKGLDSRAVLALGGVSGFVAFLAVILVGLLVAGWWVRPAVDRAVMVAVEGVPTDAIVGLRLAGQKASTRDGLSFVFNDLPVGSSPVAWSVGDGCDDEDCPGSSCPEWCATGGGSVDVEPGVGTLSFRLPVTAASPRRVRVRTSVWGVRGPVTGDLGDGRLGRSDGGDLVFDDVTPGPYSLTIRAGRCKAEHVSCVSIGECPPGCASLAQELRVSVGPGEWLWEVPTFAVRPAPEAVPLDAPVAAPDPEAPALVQKSATASQIEPSPPASPTRVTELPSSSKGSSKTSSVAPALSVVETSRPKTILPMAEQPRAGGAAQVRKVDFGPWVEAHPEHRGGWGGGATAGGLATGMTWELAHSFCADRGGLLKLYAKPHTWSTEDGSPAREWRSDGERPAWRRHDGANANGVAGDPRDASTGFRCAK